MYGNVGTLFETKKFLVASAQARVSGPIVCSTGLPAHDLAPIPSPSSSLSGIFFQSSRIQLHYAW